MSKKKIYLEKNDKNQHYLKFHKRTHSQEGGFQIIEVEKERKNKKLQSLGAEKFYIKKQQKKGKMATKSKGTPKVSDDFDTIKTIHHAYDEFGNLRHHGYKKIKVAGHIIDLDKMDIEFEPSEYPERKTTGKKILE